MWWCVVVVRAQLCSTICDPMDCSPPGASVHGIIQARMLEWVAFPPPGVFPTQRLNPCLLHWKWMLYHWATREAPNYFNSNYEIKSISMLMKNYGSWKKKKTQIKIQQKPTSHQAKTKVIKYAHMYNRYIIHKNKCQKGLNHLSHTQNIQLTHVI